MPDPKPNETVFVRRRGRSATNGVHAATDEPTLVAPRRRRATPSFLPALLGTLGALLIFALLIGGSYYGFRAFTAATTKPATAPGSASDRHANPAIKWDDPAVWVVGSQPAQNITGDGSADISWWQRTFDLPKQAAVTDFLKGQGLDVSRLVPLHYSAAPDATMVTYQVSATVPAELYRVPKATWAPADPDMRPFAAVVVLNHDLPAGQFWNTALQSVAEPAGTRLNFAWKVTLDKKTNAVTTDRLPYDEGEFTQLQVAQEQAETDATVAQLKGRIQAIDAQVQGDLQAKLAQVPADPPRPGLMSSRWNHGDGSGEPTKSAERIGGGTVAGAAGGAAIGAAAGDAGMGAGIGAGVGLLGGFIYDTVSKNNDRHAYERRAAAENAERMGEWRSQVRALNKQRDQLKRDAAAEKQQQLQDLANKVAAAGGRLDAMGQPADIAPPATYSDAPKIDLGSDQPSGPILNAPSAKPPAESAPAGR